MGKFWHVLAQIGLTALNIGSVASGALPPPYGWIAVAVVSGIQTGLASWHHASGK